MNTAINREVEVNSPEAKSNHDDLDAKGIAIAAPFIMAIFSVLPYNFFLLTISNRLNGRSAQELISIMGSEISTQLILDNAFRIGVAVALTSLIASFLIVILFWLASVAIERANSFIDKSFCDLLERAGLEIDGESDSLPISFMPFLLLLCALIYAVMYVVSVVIDMFRFALLVIGG